jgi:hemoglobin
MGDTIYERAGGAEAFLRLATAHHQRCLDDPELNHPFGHPNGHPQHVERLAAYWAQVLGGPDDFTTVHGSDHPAMIDFHNEGNIPADWGDRFVACFVAAMDDAGLPDDPQLRQAMTEYMRHAVTEVMSKTPLTQTMPRWGWDGPGT